MLLDYSYGKAFEKLNVLCTTRTGALPCFYQWMSGKLPTFITPRTGSGLVAPVLAGLTCVAMA